MTMEESSPASSTTERLEQSGTTKQAACLSCRRSKTRCLRSAGDIKCKRCSQTDADCVVPEYHVGRKKGIKNKRTGLDKAVYRIEQALKKSRTSSGQSEDDQNVYHLQSLLSAAQGLAPHTNASSDLIPTIGPSPHNLQPDGSMQQSSSLIHPSLPTSEDQFVLDGAENPLQLLAHASDLSAPQPSLNYGGYVQSPHSVISRADTIRDTDLAVFFGPLRPRLDVGEDIDPVDMGFVSNEEAEFLFKYFYQNLSHTRWGMDQNLHTAKFVRHRSSFLFTSIMAAAALFIPSAAALSKRLSVHAKKLAQHVIANRNRSPEVVLAFMVNIPWMSPGRHWADDETCTYMAMALTIAMDISLNKVILPATRSGHAAVPKDIPQAECITAKKALELDGFESVDPSSSMGQRLLRRRERVWLALFVLDRGVCLSRGRTFTVPVTPLIETCDAWHKSELADMWDGSIIASAVMRRDLVALITDVKQSCDTIRHADGNSIAETIQNIIEDFFNRWYATWAYSIHTEGNKRHHLPPYVEILVTHLRLSIYSIVVNHPTAPLEVKRFFRAAGLASALNVMRVAVQGEGQLKSIPNNSSIMISFAALFALRLSTLTTGGSLSLAPSIRTLIEETANVMERIGSTPPHRKGISALYGRHLREVVNAMPDQAQMNQTTQIANNSRSMPSMAAHHAYMELPHDQGFQNMPPDHQSHVYPSEPLQFSAMSDCQIVEAIHNAGDELEICLPNFQVVDERVGLDWLDWFNMESNGNI